MASPQKENGHTEIANELLEAFILHKFTEYQRVILLFIWRKTYGWGKKEDRISNSQFVKGTGIPKGKVSETLRDLRELNLVTCTGNKKLGVNKDWERWKVTCRGNSCYLHSKQIVTCTGTTKESKETTKEKGFSLKGEKQILSTKSKNMKGYNEDEHYKEKAIDLDTGEEINPAPPKEKKNEQAHSLRKYFYLQCKKHLQTIPKENKTVDYLLSLGAIKSLSKPQITEMINEWFASGKEASELVHITRCFSTNNINTYKANHTNHEN